MLIEFPLQFTCILGDLGVAMHTCVMHISKSLYVDLFRRFCTRSLLRDSLDYSLIDKIPGRPNDRKTLLGELNWIFTAVTDTIAWNVLPHGTSQPSQLLSL